MGLLFADLPGNFRLSPQGVDRHGATFEAQQLQQLRDGRDLVRLVFDGHLPQCQPVLAGPRRHQMQHGLAGLPGEGATQRFAIDGDQLASRRFVKSLRPLKQTGRELVALQRAQHAAKRVVRRDAARQLQEHLQPVGASLAEQFDVRPIFRAAQHGQDRHGHDVQQEMVAPAHHPRIAQIRKTSLQSIEKFACRIIHDRCLRWPSRDAARPVLAISSARFAEVNVTSPFTSRF